MTNKTFNQITADAQTKLKKLAKQNGWTWFYNLHQREVVIYAEKLLKIYKQGDRKILIIACWLHDIAHYYAKSPKEILAVKATHHIDGAKIAGEFLKKYQISADEIKRIQNCILCHRNTKPYQPKTLEEKMMAVADTMSHFGSIFYFTYFKFHPDHSLEQMIEDDLAKIKRDRRDINLLPRARKLVAKECQLIQKLLANYSKK